MSTPSRSVLVLRVIALSFAIAAVGVAFAVTREPKIGTAAPSGGRYVCPMHPEATADAPGDCPICHMALVSRSEMAPDPGASEGADFVRTSVGAVQARVLPRDLNAPAWMEDGDTASVLFYKDEIGALTAQEEGDFFTARAPNVGIHGHLSTEAPIRWDGAMSRVRFRLERSLRPGEVGWVKLEHAARPVRAVSSKAVLQSPDGPHVLLYSETDHTFTKRPIEIGKAAGGFTAVISGVGDHDAVAETNVFFLDAEQRLHAEPRRELEAMP